MSLSLESVRFKHFTVFEDEVFQFCPGLNIIAGENGSGKSHILKTCYSLLSVCSTGKKESASEIPTKTYLQPAIARKLRMVFRPDELGRLARRQQGRTRCDLDFKFSNADYNCMFGFSTTKKTEVELSRVPAVWIPKSSVYLPTRELFSIYPNFVSFYETAHINFEETYRDTCILLGAPLAKGPRESGIKELLEPIEQAIGTGVSVLGRTLRKS